MSTDQPIKLLTEEDFAHLPEEERPYKVPFYEYSTSRVEAMVWTGGKIFNPEHEHKQGHSLSHDERMFKVDGGELFRQSILEGKRALGSCSICHKPHYSLSYIIDVKEQLIKYNRCFRCDFWEVRVNQKRKPEQVVIGGNLYTLGSATSGNFRGMGGRRFDVEFIAGPNKGKRVTTYDLWSGGIAPAYWRNLMQDNAKFLGGAERAEIDSTHTAVAWNPSDPKAPAYPLPNQAGLV